MVLLVFVRCVLQHSTCRQLADHACALGGPYFVAASAAAGRCEQRVEVLGSGVCVVAHCV